MKTLRIIYRSAYLLVINLAFAIIGFTLNLFFKSNPKKLQQYIAKSAKLWAKYICMSLNIDITIHGKMPDSQSALIIANHVGCPDIFVLGSCFQVLFVSKEEIRNWPLIGFLAELGHTIFVDRTRKQKVRETILSIKDRLESGFSVLLFPEAQVTDGKDVYPFKSAYFEAAILTNKPVLPIMVHYESSENPKIAQWGNQNFFSHLITLLKNPELKATVTVLPRIQRLTNRKKLSITGHKLIKKSYEKIINRNICN